jgi:hypothetical protein
MRLYQGSSCKAPFLPDQSNAGVAPRRSGRASESGNLRTEIKDSDFREKRERPQSTRKQGAGGSVARVGS